MAIPDLLLSLAIHLVKHAVYLPSLLKREDLPRIVLSDGMLMYYLDVTEVLKQYKAIDWNLTIQLAHDWGAVDILGSVLQVCQKYFDAPVPDSFLSRFVSRHDATCALMALQKRTIAHEGPGSRRRLFCIE
jgi:hypothetical protein